MPNVDRVNLRIPANLVGTELGEYLRRLSVIIAQLRDRTGGDDDVIVRIETETLYDTGIKGAEIAEIQKRLVEFDELLAGLATLSASIADVQSRISEFAPLDDSPLLFAELNDIKQRVEALENGYDS